jgi:hypothetical protein
MARHICRVSALLLVFAGWWGGRPEFAAAAVASGAVPPESVRLPATGSVAKAVLGPTAIVSEMESGLKFAARVDTGSKTCSIHAVDLSVMGGSDQMQENVGKLIRFRIANRDGKSRRLTRFIAEVSLVKSANGAEWRYKVPMTLACEGTERQVLVSLNDRSEMEYAMLLGRNLLAGNFLVDVGNGE